MARETQESITKWAEETFGIAKSCLTIINRATEEIVEMRDNALIDDKHPDIAEELADVFIVLYQVAAILGVDLHEEIDKKMAINRARKWKLRGDGCGDHV